MANSEIVEGTAGGIISKQRETGVTTIRTLHGPPVTLKRGASKLIVLFVTFGRTLSWFVLDVERKIPLPAVDDGE